MADTVNVQRSLSDVVLEGEDGRGDLKKPFLHFLGLRGHANPWRSSCSEVMASVQSWAWRFLREGTCGTGIVVARLKQTFRGGCTRCSLFQHTMIVTCKVFDYLSP